MSSSEKTESSRASKIRSQLTSFISGLVKSNVVKADDFPKDQQKELVDRLTQQAARSTQDKALDRLLGISDVNARLNRDVASNIVDILDELALPVSRRGGRCCASSTMTSSDSRSPAGPRPPLVVAARDSSIRTLLTPLNMAL